MITTTLGRSRRRRASALRDAASIAAEVPAACMNPRRVVACRSIGERLSKPSAARGAARAMPDPAAQTDSWATLGTVVGPPADGAPEQGAAEPPRSWPTRVACPLHDRRFALADGAPLTDGGGVTAHRIEVRADTVWAELADPLATAT